jgi:hypothetical protein
MGAGVSLALVRPIGSTFWELRASWASGRRVALTLDADVRRVEGHLTRVAATDEFVKVGDLLVPGDRILAVHYPSRLGDSTHVEGRAWSGPSPRPEQIAGQTELQMGDF